MPIQVDFTVITPNPGTKLFQIFAIAHSKLYAGDTDDANDGSTAVLRPIQLDTVDILTK